MVAVAARALAAAGGVVVAAVVTATAVLAANRRKPADGLHHVWLGQPRRKMQQTLGKKI